VDVEQQRVSFYTSCDVAIGEELCFDYGMSYWMGSEVTPVGDTRNFTLEREVLPPSGPKPATPTGSVQEVDKIMELPEDQARSALLRCLDFYGATRLDEDRMEIPFGLGESARRTEIQPSTVELQLLKDATTACISEAEAIKKANEPRAPLASNELSLVDRWLGSCPRFSTAEHDAVGVAVLLMWAFPKSHEVATALTTERWEALLAMLRADERGEGVSQVLLELEQHSANEKIRELVAVTRMIIHDREG
jgi:hypothetical protein